MMMKLMMMKLVNMIKMMKISTNIFPGLAKQACSDAGCGGSVVLKIQVLAFTIDHDDKDDNDNYEDDNSNNSDDSDANDNDDIGHN